MKRILPFLLCFVMIMGAMGCSKNDENNFDADGFMTIKIWAGDEYGGSTGAKMKEFLSKFEKTPQAQELKVKFTFQAMTSLPSSLSTASKSGKIPDIVIWDRFSTPSYNNLLVDLTDKIAAESLDTSVFMAEALSELNIDGKQYGLPMDLDPWGIYVNMDIVNQYNGATDRLEADKINTDDLGTWSKVMAAAEKLTVKDKDGKVTRSGLNTTSMDGNFFSYVYTGGGGAY